MTRKIVIVALLALALSPWALAQHPAPKIIAEIQGDPVYQVLPLDAIPAIRHPEFIRGRQANAQMKPEEPVLGITVGDESHAYSLWQLDEHEIVNDTISGTAIAATW